MTSGTTKSMVQLAGDIGTAFQHYHSYEEGVKCFYVCHGGFNLQANWQSELKRKYMELRNLTYIEDLAVLKKQKAKEPPPAISIQQHINKCKNDMVWQITKRMSR